MQHFRSLEDVHLENTWLTIGSFDGVHAGHRKLAEKMMSQAHAHGAPAVVLTFHPHPSIVLGKRQDPFYLTSPDEKASILGDLGIDYVITHPFDRSVANTSAHDFIQNLHEHLGMVSLWIGYDFALGRDREGDAYKLSELGEEFGYKLHVFDPVMIDGVIVSSSQVRTALVAGNVKQAARLLERPYSVRGTVVYGDGRGRSIGIPTANLNVWPEKLLPRAGVYVCRATIKENEYGAVANVGVRPTFESQPVSPRVEAHLLEFDEDLYGESIELSFIDHLRDEKRFSGVQALVDQIHRDIERGRTILANHQPAGKGG